MPNRINLNTKNEQLVIGACNHLIDNYAGEFNSFEEGFFGDVPIKVMKYHSITEAQFEVIEKTYKKYEKHSLPFDFDDLKPKPRSETKDDIDF